MQELYRRRKDLPEQAMGRDLMVFDSENDRVHVLNGTAAFIWKCLDGVCGLETIEKRLGEAYDLSGVEDLSSVIRRTLLRLREKGLVEKA